MSSYMTVIDEKGLIPLREIDVDRMEESVKKYRESLRIYEKYFFGSNSIEDDSKLIEMLKNEIDKQINSYENKNERICEILYKFRYSIKRIEGDISTLTKSLERDRNHDPYERQRKYDIDRKNLTDNKVIEFFDDEIIDAISKIPNLDVFEPISSILNKYSQLDMTLKKKILKGVILEYTKSVKSAVQDYCKANGHQFSDPIVKEETVFEKVDPTDPLDQRGNFVRRVAEHRTCKFCNYKNVKVISECLPPLGDFHSDYTEVASSLIFFLEKEKNSKKKSRKKQK